MTLLQKLDPNFQRSTSAPAGTLLKGEDANEARQLLLRSLQIPGNHTPLQEVLLITLIRRNEAHEPHLTVVI